MIDFTTEEGCRVRMSQDEHGHIVVRLSVEDGRNDVFFYLTAAEVEVFSRALGVTNTHPMVGAWGFLDGRPIHIPSYNKGQADATGGVM